MRYRPSHLFAAATSAALALACDSGTGPRPESALTIIRLAEAAPPLQQSEVSFYAVRGEGREGRIHFQAPGGGEGEEYLRLTFDDESLVTDAAGLPVAPGDSVLITVRAVDPARILFEFEPSGILFNPLDPPELRIRYGNADDDFDEDGDLDEDDAALEFELGLWRQEVLGTPFSRLGTVLEVELDEIEAELVGFTRYAIAY